MSIKKNLVQIANVLDSYRSFQSEEIDSLLEAAIDIGKSWSGSWFGYHSRVYYKDFMIHPQELCLAKHGALKLIQEENGESVILMMLSRL